jgi:hypothetical protein
MANELEKVVSREKAISSSSPWILATTAAVFTVFAIVALCAAVFVPNGGAAAAGCAACFGVASFAFAAQLRAVQSKVNLEIAKAVNEIRSRLERQG